MGDISLASEVAVPVPGTVAQDAVQPEQTKEARSACGLLPARPDGLPVRVCMHVLGAARTDARVLREATALSQAGAQVTILDIEREASGPRDETIEGVVLWHLRMPSWFVPVRFKPWFLVKVVRLLIAGTLALLRMDADIYHAHDDVALPACYLAALLRRKPLVFDAHELPLVEPAITRWRLLCGLARLLLRALLPRCTGIITVSPPLVDELRRRYGGQRAVVVRNMPAYQPAQASDRLRQRLGLGPQTRIVLYQGYLSPARGLERVVRAARFLDPQTVVVMMGSGSSQPALEEVIAAEGAGERVQIIPPVPYAELLGWTASADLGLAVFPPDYSPSIKLCLPNKLFEYVMAGVPVLASPLDAVEQVLMAYGVGAVVRSLEPVAIARAINALLADGAGLAQMRQRALAAARTDLCWEHEQHRLIQLYQRIFSAVTKRT